MMIGRFLTDNRGTSFEVIALSVSIIAVGFVASADMLDYMTKKHQTSQVIAKATPATTTTSDLDTSATSSLPKLISRSVLDPCTGAVK